MEKRQSFSTAYLRNATLTQRSNNYVVHMAYDSPPHIRSTVYVVHMRARRGITPYPTVPCV